MIRLRLYKWFYYVREILLYWKSCLELWNWKLRVDSRGNVKYDCGTLTKDDTRCEGIIKVLSIRDLYRTRVYGSRNRGENRQIFTAAACNLTLNDIYLSTIVWKNWLNSPQENIASKPRSNVTDYFTWLLQKWSMQLDYTVSSSWKFVIWSGGPFEVEIRNLILFFLQRRLMHLIYSHCPFFTRDMYFNARGAFKHKVCYLIYSIPLEIPYATSFTLPLPK